MEKLDEHLRTEFKRLSPLGDPAGVVDRVLRRAAHRHASHRVGIVLLTMSVIVGSSAGIYVLSRVFGRANQPTAGAVTVTNGAIAFERVAEGKGNGSHVWLVMPDGNGERQLTFGDDLLDRWPAWSPDGTQMAFVRLDYTRATFGLKVLDLVNGGIRSVTPPDIGAARPDWSPDGTRIAFAGVMGETPESGIYVVGADGSGLRQITDPRFAAPDNPEWSPEGSQIAFCGNLDTSKSGWDVYVMNADGSSLRNLTQTPDEKRSECVAGWLPNGNLLIGQGPGEIGPGQPVTTVRWLEVTPVGDTVRVVYEGPVHARAEASISPDGRFALFYTPDEGEGTIRFMDLDTGEVTAVTTGGHTPAWQPIPEGATIPPVVPTPDPSVQDIGLGFPVCNVTSVTGRFGDPNTIGIAFVATKTSDTGGCPDATGAFNVVGVDFTQDGLADASYGPLDCPFGCAAFAAPDIDGDGVDEIAVSVPTNSQALTLFVINVRALAIEPIEISEPGDPHYGLGPGPVVFPWGGHISFTGGAYCGVMEGHPPVSDAGFVVWQAVFGTDARPTVHETLFQLQEGALILVATHDYRAPVTAAGLPPGGGSDLCGAPVA